MQELFVIDRIICQYRERKRKSVVWILRIDFLLTKLSHYKVKLEKNSEYFSLTEIFEKVIKQIFQAILTKINTSQTTLQT